MEERWLGQALYPSARQGNCEKSAGIRGGAAGARFLASLDVRKRCADYESGIRGL